MVIAGKDKGLKGEILEVQRAAERVVVAGVNVRKKHVKPQGNQPGQIIERPFPIHASNVMVIEAKTGQPTKISYQMVKDKKVRVSRKTGNEI